MERAKIKKGVPTTNTNTTSAQKGKPVTPALSTTSNNKSTISELKKNLAKKK